MKRNNVIAVTSILILGIVMQVGATGLVTVADFDIPPPNNINGAYGAFSPSASELTYVTMETVDNFVKRGNAGASMRLDYNVGKSGSFSGFWMKLGPEDVGNKFDASKYSVLSFWIKGDPKSGIPKQVKIELKGDPGSRIGRQYIKDITGDWKKVTLPLEKYAAQGVDISKLNEFVLVFENRVAAPGTEGRVWIDTIAFE